MKMTTRTEGLSYADRFFPSARPPQVEVLANRRTPLFNIFNENFFFTDNAGENKAKLFSI